MEKTYFVYIIANQANTVLYTGITSDIIRRVNQHKNKVVPGFTNQYNCNKLVWYETHNDVYTAIKREKQIKAGSRKRKNELIDRVNPGWNDLFEDLF